MRYKVVLRKSEEGYSVSCPGLPGCWSRGAQRSGSPGEHPKRHTGIPRSGRGVEIDGCRESNERCCSTGSGRWSPAVSPSSAAERAPVFRPSARRPAESISSSSTTPVATAWRDAAPSRASWPTERERDRDGDGERGAAGDEAHPGARGGERHRSLLHLRPVPRRPEGGRLLRSAELSHRGAHRRDVSGPTSRRRACPTGSRWT